ncbi:tripartite tricarboxylate transporter substrate binding protein [Paenalcaligenes niemegkensis]|uniref:tripartite tricarboxylate transporter substrate binding protein n=1 Tax=Paenalcaligenes niemegkensis TaxID=2895469 RepID=UPI001EE99CF0|nr:tripartite tricarboxylate transporter substrate binding protein [Paenalcaligenes niemegkensis]MCQ9618290.1 tripartite tricarboxylate transporter substrate binding protein [Paenalcaligenes niemegkensis]
MPWSAGGGTDAVARFVASGLEKELGKPVNVINRAGAGGVIGHTAISRAKADGYTIGLATAELASYHWMKTSPVSYKDMTPIAQVNFDAAAITISAKSEWDSVPAMFDDIRNNPVGTYKLSGIPAGAAYHLALAQALNINDVDPKNVVVVPSQGAAPGFQELVAGGVQIVASSVPEGKTMRDAGLVKTIAVMTEERSSAYPDIPTIGEATGRPLDAGTWRGLVGPKGMPDEAVQAISAAAKKVTESDEFLEFMARTGFGVKWSSPEDFGAMMAKSDELSGELIEKLGLAN